MTQAPRDVRGGGERAIVLAAGFGTRLQPLTFDLPKPLVPIWGEPILARTLRRLRAWGVRDVLLNCHHEAGAILSFAAAHGIDGLRVSLSFEPVILGTGGALRRAQWFLDERRPFWLINGDILFDASPEPFRRALRPPGVIAAAMLDAQRGPRTVAHGGGRIASFRDPAPGREGTATFCGVQLVRPRILDYLPADERFFSIIDAYELARRDGFEVRAVLDGEWFWADIGTPAQYIQAHRDLRPDRSCRPFVARSPGARIERGARLRDCVVWEGAHVRSTADLREAIVGRDTQVAGRVGGIVMRADRGLPGVDCATIEEFGWRPAECAIQPFGARGSARDFTRIAGPRGSVILMRYDPAREENTLYTRHARLLADLGMRVPRVWIDRPAQHSALLEDLGDESLLQRVRRIGTDAALPLYERILDPILRMHRDGPRAVRRRRHPLMPPLDARLLRWEREYFAEHFLAGRLRLSASVVRLILREIAHTIRPLLAAPPALLHRDLQSTNVLLVDDDAPAFIDFQGMRLGPDAYDWASLLCDPYVELPEAAIESLRGLLADRAPADLFWRAAIERLAQALGAFARLGACAGTESFADHIPAALRQLRAALDRVGGLPNLRAVVRDLVA